MTKFKCAVPTPRWCPINLASFPGLCRVRKAWVKISPAFPGPDAMDDDLSRFCCPNPDCSACGRRGAGNLRVAFRYGPQPRRALACRLCQHRFSERTGTPLFDCRLPEDKALA